MRALKAPVRIAKIRATERFPSSWERSGPYLGRLILRFPPRASSSRNLTPKQSAKQVARAYSCSQPGAGGEIEGPSRLKRETAYVKLKIFTIVVLPVWTAAGLLAQGLGKGKQNT